MNGMTSTTHQRSIHIDAPVEKVFDYVKDPQRQFDAYYQKETPTISDQQMTPDAGQGSTWRWHGHLMFIHFSGTNTREEYVPNERFVDRSSTGVLVTFTFEPDEAGTTLTIAAEVSSKVPFLDKVEDKVAWKGDRDLDTWLGNLKKAIEG